MTTSPSEPELSFDEFSPPSYEEWHEATVQSLKGKPFEKLITHTPEGIDLKPMYRREDSEHLSHQHSLPGEYPYVRGVNPLGNTQTPWLIAQEIPYTTPKDFNDALKHDIERGQTAINLPLDVLTMRGVIPTQDNADLIGVGGVSIIDITDVNTIIDGIDLSKIPIFIHAGIMGAPMLALLAGAAHENDIPVCVLHGCIESDPLAVLAIHGELPMSLEQAYDELAHMLRWASINTPELDVIGIHSEPYHESGANAVQELAFTLATGVEYVQALLTRGIGLNTVATSMRFSLSMGGDFFMEIAKLRAARMLWAQIMNAFGADEEAQKLRLHTRTGQYNKTALDPYVNMLRVTTESLAAAVAGTESHHSAPFDSVVGEPDEFSRRIARNVQLILQKEVNLPKIIDPAGGSYYIEWLTDQIARQAWKTFQQIEGAGGMAQALKDNLPQSQINAVATQRELNISTRKTRIVGTNMYANISEKRLQDRSDKQSAIDDRLEATEDVTPITITLADKPIDALIYGFQQGACIDDAVRALRPESVGERVPPLTQQRASEAFETLRDNALAYAEKNGDAPQLYLLNYGTLSEHKARTDFTQGFFEVGGFACINPDGVSDVDSAAKSTLESGAGAVAICSTDAHYAAVAETLAQKLKAEKPELFIILAGNPADKREAYQNAGIDEFIYLGADCLALNQKVQKELGVSS